MRTAELQAEKRRSLSSEENVGMSRVAELAEKREYLGPEEQGNREKTKVEETEEGEEAEEGRSAWARPSPSRVSEICEAKASAVGPGDFVLFPLPTKTSNAAEESAGDERPEKEEAEERATEGREREDRQEVETRSRKREDGHGRERETGEGVEGEGRITEKNSIPRGYGRGEVICVHKDRVKGTVADILRYTADGKPFKGLRAGLITGIPLTGLLLLEANEHRIEPARRANSGEFSPPLSFCLRLSSFFTCSVDPKDLETTGLCIQSCEITQIGCVPRLFRDGRWHYVNCPVLRDAEAHLWGEPHVFSAYIRIHSWIPKKVRDLTGITKALLNKKGIPLETALLKWAGWAQKIANSLDYDVPIWFVAHSGSSFDIPVLLRHETSTRTALKMFSRGCFFRHVGCEYTVDTLTLSRALPWPNVREQSHSLSLLYAQLTGRSRDRNDEHNAVGDSIALAELMGKEPFLSAWQRMKVGRKLCEEFEYQRRLKFLNISPRL
ncbi:conserved hypothetical protein [Neospora caninum Liverpool]|uniref:Exonuclease n=1 Tax=Neospora caninum (strain Liverpool) TaxID=572307 RepID=F0V7L2_NEOCL|nr:conserved hypothetical protein [Neospora caninum Liverpool]CBZ49703.1 conserved hypothetical protein [Neospora caninum Liverpool]CEL64288.1 TPA: exonuclease [Neospora caninum Liverpool]|eukprot:XP_003879738.1 conserved hypothetical protein [Neospora caninum Liverpool]